MRHIFIMLLAALPYVSRAQDVFDAVMNSSQTVVANPDADESMLAMAQFKVTALRYLNRKAVEKEMTFRQMDIQAYYMSEFLSAYTRTLTKTYATNKKDVKKAVFKYMSASAENPLFGDQDKQTTLVFVEDDSSLKPFSLDTDWQKAYEQLFPSEAAK